MFERMILGLFVVLLVCSCGRASKDDETTARRAILWGHYHGPMLDGEFSMNGEVILTAAEDGAIRRWSSKKHGLVVGETVASLPSAQFADVSRLGNVILLGKDGTVRLWNPSVSPQSRTITHGATVAEFSDDSAWALTGGENGVVRVWGVDSGTLVTELSGHLDEVWAISAGMDGQKLAAGGRDSVVSLWDISSKSRIALAGHTMWITDIDFSPDNSKLLTVSWDQTARIWDAQTGQPLTTLIGHSEPLWVGEFSPDGRKVITAGADGTARVWDSGSGKLLATATGHEGTIASIAVGRSGRIFVTGGWDKTARVWDLETGRVLAILSGHGDRVDGVAFDDAEEYLLTTSSDHTAAIWHVRY